MRVVVWGDQWVGGGASVVANQLVEVHHVVASRSFIAAFKKKDSSLAVRVYDACGGDTAVVSAALDSKVVNVEHTTTAMAAVKTDCQG
jgi:hypothetical protein